MKAPILSLLQNFYHLHPCIFVGVDERTDEAVLEKRIERCKRERGPKKKKKGGPEKIRAKAKVNSQTKREQGGGNQPLNESNFQALSQILH